MEVRRQDMEARQWADRHKEVVEDREARRVMEVQEGLLGGVVHRPDTEAHHPTVWSPWTYVLMLCMASSFIVMLFSG